MKLELGSLIAIEASFILGILRGYKSTCQMSFYLTFVNITLFFLSPAYFFQGVRTESSPIVDPFPSVS